MLFQFNLVFDISIFLYIFLLEAIIYNLFLDTQYLYTSGLPDGKVTLDW